jgi:two-component system sensor kinase FixL
LKVIIPVFSLMLFINEVAIANSFSKIIEDKYIETNVNYLAYSLLLIIPVVLFILTKMKYLNIDFNHKGAISKNSESEQLINAFSKLENAIENRDVSLRSDYKKVKSISEKKTNVLVDVSHEIRSPMHAIINFAELGIIKTKNGETEQVQSYFQNIEDCVTRLLNNVNFILDITAIDSGKVNFNWQESNVIDCVNSAIKDLDLLIKSKKIEIKLIKPQEQIVSYFDNIRLKLVITNLIANAVKFSPFASDIDIKIEMVNNFKDIEGEAFKISIIDHGIGIPKGEQEMIFEKYNQSSIAQNNSLGCGIGLSICKEVVEFHGGYIWVESNEGEGSNFSLVVPIKDEKS